MADETALLEADQRARRDARDVSRSFIVQAPAGSGKTELLIQRYLHLLETVDEPEEVLAITFTRKAAAEMHKRVVLALQKARTVAQAEQVHEQITLDAARRVLQRDADRGWQLVQSPRRLRIQTLDAFSAGVARQLPLTSGLGGLSTTIQDSEFDSLCRTAALATLDWLVGDDEASAAVEKVLTHLDSNTGTYIGYLSRMLTARDQWLEITGTGEVIDPDAVRRRLESNLADIVRHELRGAHDRLEAAGQAELPGLAAYAARNLNEAGKGEHPAVACGELGTLPTTDPAALPQWRGIAELVLTKEGRWRKTVDVRAGFPARDDGQKKAWLDIIAELSEQPALQETLGRIRLLPDAHYDDAQWQTMLALFRVLPLAVSELKRLFAERGICDHTEIALSAGAALGRADRPGETTLKLDYRIRHLLVDEMQDTSIAQYQMLETLTAGWESGDGRTFFCVGDPMQSIYRFRNAEVGQFLRARQSGLGALPLQPLTLRRNFRSGENLVHWFNTVFGLVFPRQDDIAAGAVGYSESIPVEHLGGKSDYCVHALFDADVTAEAQHTAAVVEACLRADDDGSVAILVRSRTQLPALLLELRTRGVDHRAIEIDRLTDLPEIIDVLALTRALCHLDDRAAWLALLRGPWVGLDWTDLHRLVHGAADETVWSLLCDPARIDRLSSHARAALPAFVESMQLCLRTERFETLRHRVELAWYRFSGAGFLSSQDQLANVYRYFDVLEKNEEAGNLADPAELIRILETERVSSQGQADCRVQVMTMHKAKGLQFEHVILPSLGRHTTGGQKSVLSWLNVPSEGGGQDMIISPVGPGYELHKDPLHNYIEQALRQSDQLEQDRLLYVACTRAKQSLHLIGSVTRDGDGDVKAPRRDSLLGRLWMALQDAYVAASAYADDAPADASDAQTLVLPQLRRGEPGWRIADPPPMPRSAAPPAAHPAGIDVEFYWVGRAARQAGTIVHRWLHRFVATGWSPSVGELPALRAESRRWAIELGVGSTEIDAVCDRVQAAVEGSLADERGRWLLDGDGHAELPLTGMLDDNLVSVVIDRVRIDDDGTHWIVDYKTSTHEGGDLAGFLDQEAERYTPQLDRYARIYAAYSGVERLRTALYFPLMQQFREIG